MATNPFQPSTAAPRANPKRIRLARKATPPKNGFVPDELSQNEKPKKVKRKNPFTSGGKRSTPPPQKPSPSFN